MAGGTGASPEYERVVVQRSPRRGLVALLAVAALVGFVAVGSCRGDAHDAGPPGSALVPKPAVAARDGQGTTQPASVAERRGVDHSAGTPTTSGGQSTSAFVDTTTTLDPRIEQLAEDLTVETSVREDVVTVGEPIHVTVTVTNRSSRPQELWSACGVPAVVELARQPGVADPFGGLGSLPGIPGANFSTESESLKTYLRYGEQDEPHATLSTRSAPAAGRLGDQCGGFEHLTVSPGASVTGDVTGFVSPGPAWTATPDLTITTRVGTPAVKRQSVATTTPIRYRDHPTRAAAYYRAVAEAGASPVVMGWVAAHQGPNPSGSGGGVPVAVEYRRGQWRLRMAANIDANTNADLVITTEHDTGAIIDIRELHDGFDASNDPDAANVNPAKETILFQR